MQVVSAAVNSTYDYRHEFVTPEHLSSRLGSLTLSTRLAAVSCLLIPITRSATSLSTSAGGFNYLFSTEEQEREFRGIKPERPLNSRLMYFDLIELIKKK